MGRGRRRILERLLPLREDLSSVDDRAEMGPSRQLLVDGWKERIDAWWCPLHGGEGRSARPDESGREGSSRVRNLRERCLSRPDRYRNGSRNLQPRTPWR